MDFSKDILHNLKLSVQVRNLESSRQGNIWLISFLLDVQKWFTYNQNERAEKLRLFVKGICFVRIANVASIYSIPQKRYCSY